MYTTIEPRLIALLNEEPSKFPSHSLELPPLQDHNILKASGRPFLLEPGPGPRTRNAGPASSSGTQCAAHPASRLDEQDRVRDDTQSGKRTNNDRALGITSPQSLRKILSEDVSTSAVGTSKKRSLVDTNKDDFVQLPQPPKKQKTTKQVVPPIIIGLFEPPPQATLFPPIASSSFHDSHGRNTLNTVPLKGNGVAELPKAILNPEPESLPAANKESKKKKDARTRKRWTEEETNNLLLGVKKHGLGCWTDILDDSEFTFGKRSAADLKDRFRTCCPKELRGDTAARKPLSQPTEDHHRTDKPPRSKSSLLSENILINDEDLPHNPNPSESNMTKPKKTRTHRRKLEDLVQLGIEGPFRKSNRRERRPFSEEEDRQILSGYQLHGPAWTKIQRDPQFHLITRQPTDLRDRFRNKYPEKFRSEDKRELISQQDENAEFVHVSLASDVANPKGKPRSELNINNSASLMSFPSLIVGKQMTDTSKDTYGKENHDILPSLASTNFQTSSRDALRIQEIISQENDISRALPPQPSSFNFRESFAPFAEASSTEQSDTLAFTQSLDWNASMAAPFNTSEMDISRLLLDDTWIDNSIAGPKDKLTTLEPNKTVTVNSDQPGCSLSYLLGDSEPMVDINDSF
jgi:hypothetical protein